MAGSHNHVDKPQPRWQALLALAAVGGIYMALPKTLILGPTWLLPAFIAVSLAPTIVAHRMGRHSFNHVLGIVNSSIITLALIGSVMLLVKALPSHQEEPVRLLVSGAALWLTNVLVFAYNTTDLECQALAASIRSSLARRLGTLARGRTRPCVCFTQRPYEYTSHQCRNWIFSGTVL